MASQALLGVEFPLLAASALWGEGLTVRLSTRNRRVVDVMSLMLVVNRLGLIALAGLRVRSRSS